MRESKHRSHVTAVEERGQRRGTKRFMIHTNHQKYSITIIQLEKNQTLHRGPSHRTVDQIELCSSTPLSEQFEVIKTPLTEQRDPSDRAARPL